MHTLEILSWVLPSFILGSAVTWVVMTIVTDPFQEPAGSEDDKPLTGWRKL